MALCALIALVSGSILLAIHWLGTIGIVRDYTVSMNSAGRGFRLERWFGIGSPSLVLTRVDGIALVVFGASGVLWVLGLARRVGAFRLGATRASVIIGLALAPTAVNWLLTGAIGSAGSALQTVGLAIVLAVPFVETALWRTDERVAAQRTRLSRWIGRWYLLLVTAPLFVVVSEWHRGDPVARPAGLGWSIARHFTALGVIGGGLIIAMTLTARWINSARALGAPERDAHDTLVA